MNSDLEDLLTKNTDAQKAAPAEKEAMEQQVLDWLKRHPDFLLQHPDILQTLALPDKTSGDNVVDLQRFMVRRLNDQIDQHKDSQRHLVNRVRDNLSVQARVHEAVLAILQAASFEHLIHIVTREFALFLQVDIVTLCIEGDVTEEDATPPLTLPTGIHILPPGMVEYLITPPKQAVLRESVVGESYVFGAAAPLVQSDALIKLQLSEDAPMGLLAFGSREKDTFSSGQGTEMLTFLANCLEACIRRWLEIS